MNEVLQQKIAETLAHIYPEKDEQEQFDDVVFDLAEQLAELTGNENIASKIYEHSDRNVQKLSILFDILIWSTPDNGAELLRETKEWFLQNDPDKLELVLHITNVYPYQPAGALEKRLLEIRSDFPSLKKPCDYWLESIRQKL
ncbi:hypothetical protein [Fluviicola sp.]|uniref:hypothetical protein n=1 Tax=Fluviicola sp. TaxID=1917219 RepID=UPI0031E0B7E4